MKRKHLISAALLCAVAAAWAVETKTWIQSEAAEFEQGTLKGVALGSNGRLSLAPVFRETYDPDAAHIWSLAADGKGGFFAGGTGGKVYHLDSSGKGRLYAELAGGEVYALNVDGRGILHAATSPEGKLYRLPGGKPELLYDTKAKYVWAIVFDRTGALYAATGDPGQIHRVTAPGRGELVYDSGETHVRSMILDGAGNLVAGTEPGGLVLRVSPKGEGFVLHQTARREVTALVLGADSRIYAAAVGNKAAAGALPAAPPAQIPIQTQTATATAQVQNQPPRPAQPPATVGTGAPTIAGGSEIYRIDSDGYAQRIWTNAQQAIYSLALDPQGRLIAGAGNQGHVYRIDSERFSTRLLDLEPAQITAMVSAPNGAIIAATANPGKLYQVGPAMEKSGVIESDVFDAASFTYWGRLRWESLGEGSVALETRSGNLDRPQKNWSPWTAVTNGSRIASPAARFLQWRATLTSPDGVKSPELLLVEAAYQAKNVAPLIDRIEITPYNYRFPAPSTISLSAGSNLTLPPIGQTRRTSPSAGGIESSASQTMNREPGMIGARWRSVDANGDSMQYKIEIRGVGERDWKLLKDEVRDPRYAWDATAWADGRYILRVTATDLPDNLPAQALSAQIESEPFTIDNTPPEITDLTGRMEGNRIVLSWRVTDTLTPLSYCEYSVNGAEWKAAEPTTRLTDSLQHDYRVEIPKGEGTEFVIAVRAGDENENGSVRKIVVR